MAKLEKSQVLEILENKKGQAGLAEAIYHENRLRMHVEPIQDKAKLGPAYLSFKTWCKAFLGPQKFKKFEQLIPAPLPTVELTDTIYKELYRVFEGQNSYLGFNFTQPELEQDFRDYLEELELGEFFKTEGWEALKVAINSVAVVDLAIEQKGSRPEPYIHLVNISRVRAMENRKDGYCEYVIFEQGPKDNLKLVVLDESHYRVLVKDATEKYTIFEVDTPHNLGFTPAKSFWNEALGSTDTIQRKGPITNSLGMLDKALFWEVSIEYYNTYGVFPIYWGYKQACNYIHPETNTACQRGIITVPYGEGVKSLPCPKCEENRAIGAGSFISIPAPKNKEQPDLREPVGMLGVDVDSLEFNERKQEARKNNIYLACVGKNGEPNNNQAQNEKQVTAAFESKQNVLLWVKRNFEVIHKWGIDTIALLRYGSGTYLGSAVNYGDRFYLQSENELVTDYQTGKAAGLPSYELASLRMQIGETRYRYNAELRERNRMLAELEPYPDTTVKELAELVAISPSLVNLEDFVLKLNFDSIVKEFEREYGPITRFMDLSEYETRIFLIKQQFNNYGKARNGAQASPRID